MDNLGLRKCGRCENLSNPRKVYVHIIKKHLDKIVKTATERSSTEITSKQENYPDVIAQRGRVLV
jgi:hypothetical protein